MALSDELVDELCQRLRDDAFRPWHMPSDEDMDALTPEQAARLSAACDFLDRREAMAAVFGPLAAAQARREGTPGYPVFTFVSDIPDTPEGLLES